MLAVAVYVTFQVSMLDPCALQDTTLPSGVVSRADVTCQMQQEGDTVSICGNLLRDVEVSPDG